MRQSPVTAKKLFLKMLCIGIALALLHIVLERSMAFAASDVALTALVRVLDVAIILCDAAFFFVEYALLASAVFHFPVASVMGAVLLPVALCLFKHLGNWWAFLITEKVSDAVNLRLSALTAAGAIAIELVQYALVLAVLLGCKGRSERVRVLLTCGVLLAINLVSRIIGDVEYGAPTSASEIGVMLAYYAFDIFLYFPVAALTITHIIQRQNKKDPTEKQ